MSPQIIPKDQWTTTLFGCLKDIQTCCFGCWCEPCLYGDTASRVDDTNSCAAHCCIYYLLSMVCACACVAQSTRKKLRERYNLEEHPPGDFWAHCLCAPCAVCQDARELKRRSTIPPNIWTLRPTDAELAAEIERQSPVKPGAAADADVAQRGVQLAAPLAPTAAPAQVTMQ